MGQKSSFQSYLTVICRLTGIVDIGGRWDLTFPANMVTWMIILRIIFFFYLFRFSPIGQEFKLEWLFPYPLWALIAFSRIIIIMKLCIGGFDILHQLLFSFFLFINTRNRNCPCSTGRMSFPEVQQSKHTNYTFITHSMCDPYVLQPNYSFDLILGHMMSSDALREVWEDLVFLPLSRMRPRKVVRLWKVLTEMRSLINLSWLAGISDCWFSWFTWSLGDWTQGPNLAVWQ